VALSDSDREWVRLVVKEAIQEIHAADRQYTDDEIEKHLRECVNFVRLKAYIVGVAAGCSLAGGGIGYVISTVVGKIAG